MHPTKNKLLCASVVVLAFIMGVLIAQEWEGLYECGSCSPNDPTDGSTDLFIRSHVNQFITNWEVGDFVTIGNPNTGEFGNWGRTSGFVSTIQYVGPAAGGASGGGGSGGGGTGGGGSGGGGPVPDYPGCYCICCNTDPV